MNYALENQFQLVEAGYYSPFPFSNRNIAKGSLKGVFSCDVIANELSIDTVSLTVRYDPTSSFATVYGTSEDREIYQLVGKNLYGLSKGSSRMFLTDLPFGTEAWWYLANESGGGIPLTFYGYVKSIERIGKYLYKITCFSGIGLLDRKIHVGGLYSGETASVVIQQIIGDTFVYNVGTNVGNVRLYGHLPYDKARNNLHRVLFAVGAVARKLDFMTYSFVFLNSASPTVIPPSRVSISGSVSYQLPANRVEVTEHGFYQTANDETVVLYSNAGGTAVDHLTVVFQNAPAYDVAATSNLTINELGVNYAVVSGTGTLTGKMYTHSRQILVVNDNPNNDPENVKRVTDNELISSINSRSVANRLMSYYKSTKLIKAKVRLISEKVGDYVQLDDAYGEPVAGFIQRMELAPTTIKAATLEIVDGYNASDKGNTFTKRTQLYWKDHQSPDTVTLTINTTVTRALRFVVIGGGSGGQAGYDGDDGGSFVSEDYYSDECGKSEGYWQEKVAYVGYISDENPTPHPQGGAAGEAGTPGKVLIFDVDLSSMPTGQTVSISLAISIGKGGSGGASNGAAGEAGNETTVSFTDPATAAVVSLTSADGEEVNGWADIMNGSVFAMPGTDGIRGGNGGYIDGKSDGNWSSVWNSYEIRKRDNISNAVKAMGTRGGDGQSVGDAPGGAGADAYGYDGSNDDNGLKGYSEAAYYASVDGHQFADGYYQFPQAADGGCGGGAAYGAAGKPGGSYSRIYADEYHMGGYWLTIAAGGDGANALPPPKSDIGGAGNGGNGGGAGGNMSGGFVYGVEYWNDDDAVYLQWGGLTTNGRSGGKGGKGSRGGDGGNGGIIIYS